MLLFSFFLSLVFSFGYSPISDDSNCVNANKNDQNTICSYSAYTVFYGEENGCCIMQFNLTNNGPGTIHIVSSTQGTVLSVASGSSGSVLIKLCAKTCFKIVNDFGFNCANSPCYVHGVDYGWNFCFGPEICKETP